MNRLYNDPATKGKRRELRQNQTDAERKVWSILRRKQIGLRFFRQYNIGPYIIDFYCPTRRLAVELDGSQHGEDRGKTHDEQRTTYLAQHDIKVLRFWNDEVLKNIEGVWQKIKEILDNSPS